MLLTCEQSFDVLYILYTSVFVYLVRRPNVFVWLGNPVRPRIVHTYGLFLFWSVLVLVDLSPPVGNVIVDDLGCLVDGEVSANGFDKVSFGVCD